jgi:hypothetical protein
MDALSSPDRTIQRSQSLPFDRSIIIDTDYDRMITH